MTAVDEQTPVSVGCAAVDLPVQRVATTVAF